MRPSTAAAILHYGQWRASFSLLDKQTNIRVAAMYIKSLIDAAKDKDANNPHFTFMYEAQRNLSLHEYYLPMNEWDPVYDRLLAQQYTQPYWMFVVDGKKRNQAWVAPDASAYGFSFWQNYNDETYKTAFQ